MGYPKRQKKIWGNHVNTEMGLESIRGTATHVEACGLQGMDISDLNKIDWRALRVWLHSSVTNPNIFLTPLVVKIYLLSSTSDNIFVKIGWLIYEVCQEYRVFEALFCSWPILWIILPALAGIYRERHPEHTVFYRVFFYYFERFLREYESRFEKEQRISWWQPRGEWGLFLGPLSLFFADSRAESILSLWILWFWWNCAAF